MAASFLVVGATGNTGRSVVETLSNHLKSGSFSDYRILAMTRSANSSSAKALAKFPHVEIVEYNWAEITTDWLREHKVDRAFIASHNEPPHFTEESTFHVAALGAGVKYVVRISTTAANVTPDCKAYYPRAHWAIEAMLDSPGFGSMHWSSLQPNVFSQFYLGTAAELVKTVRNGGKQHTLRLMANADSPVGIIDASEVGIFAAHLLLQDDTSAHNKCRYVLNGPEDITGQQIVAMVEKHIGAKVEDVKFKDVSFVDDMAAASSHSKNVILTLKHAPETGWEGKAKAETTSKEVLQIAAPKKTPTEVMDELLQ
ncbi:hypothetical protein ACET3X_002007 [Alternaria dauci]|uniref:NmrA-like domain-containing protein n=1 Tax=Alternaria dauci TaxID=48095 RepID=A0ABR3UZT3_9PLEO